MGLIERFKEKVSGSFEGLKRAASEKAQEVRMDMAEQKAYEDEVKAAQKEAFREQYRRESVGAAKKIATERVSNKYGFPSGTQNLFGSTYGARPPSLGKSSKKGKKKQLSYGDVSREGTRVHDTPSLFGSNLFDGNSGSKKKKGGGGLFKSGGMMGSQFFD